MAGIHAPLRHTKQERTISIQIEPLCRRTYHLPLETNFHQEQVGLRHAASTTDSPRLYFLILSREPPIHGGWRHDHLFRHALNVPCPEAICRSSDAYPLRCKLRESEVNVAFTRGTCLLAFQSLTETNASNHRGYPFNHYDDVQPNMS